MEGNLIVTEQLVGILCVMMINKLYGDFFELLNSTQRGETTLYLIPGVFFDLKYFTHINNICYEGHPIKNETFSIAQ